MTRTIRLIAVAGLFVLVGLAGPSDVYAQRHGSSGGGGGRTGVAVPRTYHGGGYYRPYYRGYSYYRPYYYRPYYYPWYAYHPYYYSPWYFSFGIGFGWGSYAPAYPYAYPYPYTAGYPYPAPYPYSSSYPSSYPSSAPSPASTYYGNYAPPPSGSYQVQTSPPASGANNHADLGTLSLRVSPADAAIVIDGEPWDRPRGDDRLSIDLPEGPHRVEVHKEGYGTYTRTVDVVRARTTTLNVGLTPGGFTQTARVVR